MICYTQSRFLCIKHTLLRYTIFILSHALTDDEQINHMSTIISSKGQTPYLQAKHLYVHTSIQEVPVKAHATFKIAIVTLVGHFETESKISCWSCRWNLG